MNFEVVARFRSLGVINDCIYTRPRDPDGSEEKFS